MWKKVSKLMIALALTIPMSVTVVAAQSAQDADIWSYSQDLNMRIQNGRQTGQLNSSDYNNLNGLWTKIEMIRRQYTNKNMGPNERNAMMASLTTLDRQLTENLKDYDLSHYQNWDPNKRSWRQNWWTGINGGATFNDEIDSYQRSLKSRIDRGRSSGQLTGSEVNRLTAAYNNIDAAQRQYRMAGISNWERNSLMTMLTQLDRDITSQMNDQDQSRYKYWNAGNKSWSQNWWKPGWTNNWGNNVSVNPDTSDFNQEIDSYQNDLRSRIERGRSSGALNPAEVNRLMSAYAQIDRTQQQYRIGGFNHTERNSLMTSLTQLDRDITAQLRDDDRSHYRQWDPNKNTWNQSWWKNNVGNNNNGNVNNGDTYGYGHRSAQSEAFNTEVNDEQKRVKELLIRGQRNGHLTAQEVADLNRQYDEIDRLQAQYRSRGYTRTERDSVMQKLQALNNSLTSNMRDSDRNANWRQDNRDARADRKDNRWDNRDDRNNSTVSNPPVVTPPTNNNNDRQGGWGRRDRDDRNQNGGTVTTPPATTTPPVTTPPATTTPPNNNNDNRGGWGGNRNNDNNGRNDRNQNTGIVPPTSTTPTTPTTPSTGNTNNQDQDGQGRGRGRGRRNRGGED